MQVERIPLPVTATGQRDEAAWLRLRREDYTASDMGALFGVGLRKTEFGVYMDKAGARAPTKKSGYAERGHVLEAVVAHRLPRKIPGAELSAATVYLRGRDAADPAMRVGATKDFDLRVPGERLVAEIKTIAEWWFGRHWIVGGRVRPPDEVVWQVRTQAMLEDSDGGVIVAQVINAREDMHVFRVRRDAQHEAEIRRRVSAFWARFESRTPPPMHFGREAAALDAIHRAATEPPPMIGARRLAELADRHAARTRQVAEAERDLKAIEDEIRVMMGEHAVVMLPDARRLTAGKGKRRVKIRGQ